MRTRRATLAACAAVLSAGCLGDSDGADGDEPGEPGGEGSEPDGESDGNDGPGNDEPEPGELESRYGVTVEPADEAAVFEAVDLPRSADLDPAVRDAVADAVDGGYESDDPPEAVARFVARYDRVVHDGEAYELDASFPTHRLVLEPVAYDDVDEDAVVGADTFRRTPEAAEAITTAAGDGAYEAAWLPDDLEDMVAEYESVTTTDPDDGADADYYDWRIERNVDDGPPYELTASSVGEPDLPVVDYDDLPDDARAEFDAALDERHRTEEQPALLDARDGAQFVRHDGDYYRVAIDVAN